MRFLCLHGMGTNSHIFEMQTAALRYELGDHHTYEFVEGTIETPIAPELKCYLSTGDTYFAYFDQNSLSTCRKALSDLETFIQTDGPFDGVMAFSQGAALASTLIVKKFLQDPCGQTLNPIFKCAIFRVASQSTRFQYWIESIESWHLIQSIEDLLAFQFN